MPRFITCSLLLAWLFWLEPTSDQLAIHLKTRTYDPLALAETKSATRKSASREARQRLLVQFHQALTPEERESLSAAGARILGYIPDFAYVISTPPDFDWTPFPVRSQSPIAPTDKWSPLLDIPLALFDDAAEPEPVFYLVFFHEDVDPEDARNLALNQFLEVREHPNLAPHHLLVQGPEAVIRSLTEYDEVAYILPASEDLARGWPVVPCENGIVGGFPLSPLAATPEAASNGGWASNNRTAVTLTTTYGALSAKLDAAQTRAEIERALAEWSRVVQVSFRPGTTSNASRHLHFLFGTRQHGDTVPFTGASGVIAHAFFPAPPNPEPIAGDVHFNDDMPFRIGADIDLFSVTLHEIGHALGLPHTDTGNAVMYPYYRKYTALASTDIANIRRLYPSSDAAPAPTFRLTVNPLADSPADLATLAGTVENGTLPIRVQWANLRGGSGTVQADTARRWTVRNIPLLAGANQFTLTATDALNQRATQTLLVNRTASSSPAPTGLPELRPNAPPATTSAASISLSGAASAPQGIRRVIWTSGSRSGQASGTTQWTIPALPLDRGLNLVTLRAEANDSLAVTQTLAITRQDSADRTAPQITILSPVSPSIATSNATVVISGAASDSGGLAEVTWQNGTLSGSASGTNSWRADVPVYPGFNTLILRARDQAGNSAWRSLTVTRR